MKSLPSVPGVVSAGTLQRERRPQEWAYGTLVGRLIELSSYTAPALYTGAAGLVVQAQRQGEPVAWVTPENRFVYPSDLAEHGIDIDALVVIRVPVTEAVPRAGDKVLRSGAFGLIVLDLVDAPDVPTPLLSRISRLAEQRNTAVLCLTHKPADAPSLDSLVSLRAEARRIDKGNNTYECEVRVLKDKHSGRTWIRREVCRGPVGLCQCASASPASASRKTS